jgi:hypothetical protein
MDVVMGIDFGYEPHTTIFADARGLLLAANRQEDEFRWYVDPSALPEKIRNEIQTLCGLPTD